MEGLDNLRPDEAEEDVVEGGNWETITWGVDLVWHSLETGELKPLKRRVPPASPERGAGSKRKQRAYAMPSQVADAAGEAVGTYVDVIEGEAVEAAGELVADAIVAALLGVAHVAVRAQDCAGSGVSGGGVGGRRQGAHWDRRSWL